MREMAFNAGMGGGAGALIALVGVDGSACQPQHGRLLAPRAHTRDLADAAHLLCVLHGSHPGVFAHAARRAGDGAAAEWLGDLAHAFAAEREYLVRLVAAAGPLPSTPGQAETEAVVGAQRHALEMLARSDRTGCALGAAAALALDWSAIRQVFDHAARRLELEVIPSTFPPAHDSATLIATFAGEAGLERAMLFGAQQLLAQHRGLWTLLEARSGARTH